MPGFSAPTSRDVPVVAESFTANVVNDELVETCKWYRSTSGTPFQLSVSVVGWFVAPLEGALSVGAAGGATTVVNVHTVDQELAPPEFLALTLQ